jgi:hypothetical protein
MVGLIAFGIWRATHDANADVPLPIPAEQRAFQTTIETARSAYVSAPNDLVRGKERPKRGQAICSAMPSPDVKDWVGTVYNVTSTNDGSGVFSVELAEEIWVSTWNNSGSETATGLQTLIAADSPLFARLEGLREGEPVIFTGRFFMDNKGEDCFKEFSLTMDGSMSQPEFLFAFSDVRPAP